MNKRIPEEKQVVEQMIRLYCQKKEGNSELCLHCQELLDYALSRVERCRYGQHKPTCKQCPTHCYRPEMKERIRQVMRWAGPRMLYYHPLTAIRHLLREVPHPALWKRGNKPGLVLILLLMLSMGWSAQAQRRTTPIMGWSSWNTYRVNISDTLIKRQADALVATGLKESGYTYINIDDGFFGYRDEQGEMHPHPQRFPGGMKAVADYIHSLGLKAGIYSDAGAVTCGSIWDKDRNGIGAGLYGHEEQDAALYFNRWDFDFIKIDYCGAGQELDLEEQQRYTAISKAFQRASSKLVEMNICRWAFPGTWAKELAASWRISGDINCSWGSVKHIIEKNLPLSAYCREGHFNDMDMLEIGRTLSESEERVHFGLWCILSSPLLIGCDLTSIPPHSLALLKNSELIALNQDSLGLQAYPVQATEGTYVLVKDIEQTRGNVRAVAFYNPTDSIRRISIALAELELEGKTKLRDLFAQRNLKAVYDSISAVVPPHDVAIYRVEAQRRIEPRRYEAEWAYLPLFNDLGKRKKEIHYAIESKASGRRVVRYAGGCRENAVVWPHVWSDQGGSYQMTVNCLPADNRGLEVIVNGETVARFTSVTAEISFPITLHSGYNLVEMTSRTTWAPDIDCFTLRPL